MHRIFWSLLISLLSLPQTLALSAPSVYQLASLTPAQTGFTAAQIQQLKALGIKIIVPAYLPQGFRLYSLTTQNLSAGPQYQIAYTAEKGGEMFAIRGASGGMDRPQADKIETVLSPEFGAIKVLSHAGERPFLLSEWLGKGPSYQVVSPAMVNRKLQPQAISAAEFKKICQYLTVLRF